MTKILIIDDDAVDRKAVHRALRSLNDIEILEALDGESGLSMIADLGPDCVLLDYRLPDMDGLSLLNRMAENAAPVIMMTGQGDELIAVNALKNGAEDYIPKNAVSTEVLYRAVSNAMEKAALKKQVLEATEKLKQMALRDPLTGLGNRNLFNEHFDRVLAGCRRRKDLFIVLMIDLNRFKPVNDTYGHDAGDAVLKEVGHRLVSLSRDTDMFFRLGGDEFVGIAEIGSHRDGEGLLEKKIEEALRAPFHWEGIELSVGASIGAALYPDDGEDRVTLLKSADVAMYRVKRSHNGE